MQAMAMGRQGSPNKNLALSLMARSIWRCFAAYKAPTRKPSFKSGIARGRDEDGEAVEARGRNLCFRLRPSLKFGFQITAAKRDALLLARLASSSAAFSEPPTRCTVTPFASSGSTSSRSGSCPAHSTT